jgi:hypothetical protein
MEGSLETVTGVRRYRTDEEERRMVEGTLSSVITLKPAIRYQFKTGQRDWPQT